MPAADRTKLGRTLTTYTYIYYGKKSLIFVLFLIPGTVIALKFAVSALLAQKADPNVQPFTLS